MMNKKSILAVGMLITSGFAASAHAMNLAANSLNLLTGIVTGMVGVVGPQGEVLSYEKDGDTIILRLCAKNTLPSEIEEGCPLAEGTGEVRMSERDFRDLVRRRLSTISEKDLSNEQKKLLERYRSADPSVDEDSRKLADLEGRLKRNQDFKKAFPEDYDANEEKNLKAQIQGIQDRKKEYEPILNAKNEMNGLIDALIADMPGKKIKRTLRYSKDRTGIAFNLLKEISSVENCSPKKTAKAAVGALCRTSKGALFSVVARTASGKTVVKDMKSGLLVSDRVKDSLSQYDAEKLCSDSSTLDARGNLMNVSWRLPTGYPEGLNGKDNFPNQDSDFVALEANGIREVADMSGRWFWSSSVHPKYADLASGFAGYNGGVYFSARGSSDYIGAALCVGR